MPGTTLAGVKAACSTSAKVRRVSVELPLAHLDERVVLVRPDLGEVEGVEAVVVRLCLGHHLDAELPLREVAVLDRVVEVALVRLAVVTDELGGLGVGEMLGALLGDVVELDPEALAGVVVERIGV
jgi:hypothetical protein